MVGFVLVGVFFLFQYQFRSPGTHSDTFIVSLNDEEGDMVNKLFEQNFIKSKWAFSFVLNNKNLHNKIKPGGYAIPADTDAWRVAEILTSEPAMKWVVVPEGVRKEQTAEIVGKSLGWSDQKKKDWIAKDTMVKDEYTEGVYFPDSYLISRDASGLEVAQIFINRFNEKLAPYVGDLVKNNIRWDTALKIASIVEREAAGKEDMPLVAGVIWNRLLIDMKLDIDATVQYARGWTEAGWWAPVKREDLKMDSPYNTYLHKGLPPHPISNPGLDAIKAAIYPEETECYYYLHDAERQIHCAKTYEEHKKNINLYLK